MRLYPPPLPPPQGGRESDLAASQTGLLPPLRGKVGKGGSRRVAEPTRNFAALHAARSCVCGSGGVTALRVAAQRRNSRAFDAPARAADCGGFQAVLDSRLGL